MNSLKNAVGIPVLKGGEDVKNSIALFSSSDSISEWVNAIPSTELVDYAHQVDAMIPIGVHQSPVWNARLLSALWQIEDRHLSQERQYTTDSGCAVHHDQPPLPARLRTLQSTTQTLLNTRLVSPLPLLEGAQALRHLRPVLESVLPFRWWLDIPLCQWNAVLPTDEPSRFALLPLSEIDGHWDDEPRCATYMDNAQMVKKFCPSTYAALSMLLDDPHWQRSRVNALTHELFEQQRMHRNGLSMLALPAMDHSTESNRSEKPLQI